MHAYMEELKNQSGHEASAGGLEELSAAAAGRDGLLGYVSCRQVAGPAVVSITLWDTEANAAAFRVTREAPGRSGAVFEVTDARAGAAAGQIPTHARLLYFDGPRAPEQVEAADFGGRERIWPAIRDLDGLVGISLLRARDLGYVVLTLATSVETLDAASRAVMTTALLPGEDLALLPGPDRMEIHHITGYQVPAPSTASS
jgi:heme-degrading monooxygenase HmoA